MSEILAYTAGILDGEGCISLYFVNGRIDARLQVVNTFEKLVDWLQEYWGGCKVRHKGQLETHKPLYRWILQGEPVRDLLKALLPFLVIKLDQAEIILEFWRVRESYGIARYCKRTPEYIKAASPLVEAMKILNRRGLAPVQETLESLNAEIGEGV